MENITPQLRTLYNCRTLKRWCPACRGWRLWDTMKGGSGVDKESGIRTALNFKHWRVISFTLEQSCQRCEENGFPRTLVLVALIKNDFRTQRLNTVHMLYVTVSEGQEFRSSLAGGSGMGSQETSPSCGRVVVISGSAGAEEFASKFTHVVVGRRLHFLATKVSPWGFS